MTSVAKIGQLVEVVHPRDLPHEVLRLVQVQVPDLLVLLAFVEYGVSSQDRATAGAGYGVGWKDMTSVARIGQLVEVVHPRDLP